MTHWILVRHGVTDWNRDGRQQGQADPPLSAEGRAQADELSRELSERSIDAIYSSDLERARATAESAAKPLGLPVGLDPRLREVDQGEWEGMLADDIAAQFPQEWQGIREDPLHARPPRGESVSELADRAMECIRDLAAQYPQGSVVVISHGLTLACILCVMRGIPLEEARRLIPANGVPQELDWP